MQQDRDTLREGENGILLFRVWVTVWVWVRVSMRVWVRVWVRVQ